MYDLIEEVYDRYDRIIILTISSGTSSTTETVKMVSQEVDKDSIVVLLDAK